VPVLSCLARGVALRRGFRYFSACPNLAGGNPESLFLGNWAAARKVFTRAGRRQGVFTGRRQGGSPGVQVGWDRPPSAPSHPKQSWDSTIPGCSPALQAWAWTVPLQLGRPGIERSISRVRVAYGASKEPSLLQGLPDPWCLL
jgi:hypothetical protein